MVPFRGWYAYPDSADDTACQGDLQTGIELRHFTGYQGLVDWAAFSPDGKIFVIGSDDSPTWLWRVDHRNTLNYLCTNLLRDFTDKERE